MNQAVSRRRRRISPQAKRGLELLVHAIEYLIAEYLGGDYIPVQARHHLDDPALEAVQLLMNLHRDIYFSCPVKPSWTETFRALLTGHGPTAKERDFARKLQYGKNNRIRHTSSEADYALQILGHAIEYLTDEYIHQEESSQLDDPIIEAIGILTALNRDVYFSSALVSSRRKRFLDWFCFQNRRKCTFERR